MKRMFFLSTLAVVLAACGPTPTNPSLVDQLRVLGVQAEPAEVVPGAMVTLSSLVADPLGEGRTIEAEYGLCVEPGPCTPETSEPLGVGSQIVFIVPPQFLDELEPEDQEIGIDLPVLFTVRAGAEEATAIKRVRVSLNPEPNVNPIVDSFTIDGHDPAALAASVIDDDEELRYRWLMTGGLLSQGVSQIGENSWSGPPGETLWVVVRDGRGGITWAVASAP